MTSISIDANPVFKEKLLELGFVKKKGEFRREVGGVLQSLYFTYRNQGGSSTRYYTFNYGISFSAVECVMEKLGVNTYGAGNSLHLKDQVRKRLGLPRNNSFIEWKIATSDSEKQLYKQINNILKVLKEIFIPLMGRFSDMEQFVDAESTGEINDYLAYDFKWPPVIYRLLGKEDKAQEYIEKRIRHLYDTLMPDVTEWVVTKDYYEMTIHCNSDASLKSYLQFAQKFNETKDDDSIWRARYEGRYPFSLEYRIL